MRVSVVGLGYVGLVTSAGLAEWGNDVVGIEASARRLDALLSGRMPFFEPGLDEIVDRHTASGRLQFESAERVSDLVSTSDVVLIAVGTHDGNGGWQTETAEAALESIVPFMADDATLVVRSTLPPEFVRTLGARVGAIRHAHGRSSVPVLLNPEFTQEARAVHDFLHPDRVVLGVIDDPEQIGTERMRTLYSQANAPVVVLRGLDAALSKLGANLFLATKISFANELATLCDAYGGNVDDVVSGMAYDARIGGSFLKAGVGFGGSCLPHQVTMTVRAASDEGIDVPLLEAVDAINHRQRSRFVDLVMEAVDGVDAPTVALLGLTFKPGTDDLRDAPALTIAAELLRRGARVVAYDPMSEAVVRARGLVPGLESAESAEAALAGAHVAGLVTEWPEFAALDWAAIRPTMSAPAVVDGRNALKPDVLQDAGFSYRAFGRGHLEGSPIDADDIVAIPVASQLGLTPMPVAGVVALDATSENVTQPA